MESDMSRIWLGCGENGLLRLLRAMGEYGAVVLEYCLPSRPPSLPEKVCMLLPEYWRLNCLSRGTPLP